MNTANVISPVVNNKLLVHNKCLEWEQHNREVSMQIQTHEARWPVRRKQGKVTLYIRGFRNNQKVYTCIIHEDDNKSCLL